MLVEFQQIDVIYDMILLSLVQDGPWYFQCNPLLKDHPSCETTFSWQKGWSLTTGFTVLLFHPLMLIAVLDIFL